MIKVNNVYKKYLINGGVDCNALNGLTLTVNDGESLAIIGKSGAGKSTLLHLISGIDVFDEGSIMIDNMDLKKMTDKQRSEYRNSIVGIVLQNFALIPEYTVFENVAIPLLFSSKKLNKTDSVMAALSEVGMSEYAKKKVNQLSGGQKQRVAIARSIVNKPKYILADEPTGALDTETSKQVIDALLNLNKNGTTVIIITHDNDIASMCSRTIQIEDGRTIEEL